MAAFLGSLSSLAQTPGGRTASCSLFSCGGAAAGARSPDAAIVVVEQEDKENLAPVRAAEQPAFPTLLLGTPRGHTTEPKAATARSPAEPRRTPEGFDLRRACPVAHQMLTEPVDTTQVYVQNLRQQSRDYHHQIEEAMGRPLFLSDVISEVEPLALPEVEQLFAECPEAEERSCAVPANLRTVALWLCGDREKPSGPSARYGQA